MSAPRRSRRLARAAIALAAAGLAACGGSSGDAAGVADADLEFVQHMIPHHEGAIEMAREVLADGADARVRALAEAIVAVQQREIEVLRGIA